MKKRRISKRQQARIKSIQEQRLNNALHDEKTLTQEITSGKLGHEQLGLLICNHGKYADVEAQDGSLHRCNVRQNLGTLVAGDEVVWRKGIHTRSVIVAVKERSSLLWRLDKYKIKKAMAANLDQIIIVFAPEPLPTTLLLDSYLVACELLNINAVLLLNKVDLINAGNETNLLEIKHYYQTIGYSVLTASSKTYHGLDELKVQLQHKTSIFTGQSGVGKSSLIQALLPETNIKIAGLSQHNKLGTHTTSTATLYHLPGSGDLIDSPGIREFTLWDMPAQTIAHGFIEFHPYIAQCKFRDCNHTNEPECAVINAVSIGKIDKKRWKNYLRLITSQ